MNRELLLQYFERLSDAPDAIPRLRRFVLDLAVRGKLVDQNAAEESGSRLLVRIRTEKAELLKRAEIRKEKPLIHLVEDELPFSLPSSWQWSQLAEIGFINPRNIADEALQASFVPMALISANYGIASTHEVRPWAEIKDGFTHFAEGDVALAKITPCFENGKSTVFRCLTGQVGAGTTELHVVRPVLVCAEFILIYLKSPHFIESGIPKMTGTAGQKRVSTEYFAYSPFPLPPLAEQNRIVAKVAELMALCDRLQVAQTERENRRNRLVTASLHHLNYGADAEDLREHAGFYIRHISRMTTRPAQIKQLRQTILSLAIQGKLVPQDPNDEPASHLLSRAQAEIEEYAREQRIMLAKPDSLKADSLPYSLPPGWVRARLCNLFKVITDGDHQPPPKSTDGVAFLTIGNVTTGSIDFSGCRFVPHSYLEGVAPYRKPSQGDILYTVVGATYGRPVFVETQRPFCVQRHIAILKPTSEISTRFLLLMMASPLVYEQASRSTTGTAQPTIPLRPLRNFVVPLPPLAEQHRIVMRLEELMAICDGLESSLITTRTESARLLESVLTGALHSSVSRRSNAA